MDDMNTCFFRQKGVHHPYCCNARGAKIKQCGKITNCTCFVATPRCKWKGFLEQMMSRFTGIWETTDTSLGIFQNSYINVICWQVTIMFFLSSHGCSYPCHFFQCSTKPCDAGLPHIFAVASFSIWMFFFKKFPQNSNQVLSFNQIARNSWMEDELPFPTSSRKGDMSSLLARLLFSYS